MKLTSAGVLEFEECKAVLRRFLSSPLGAAELDRARPISDRAALEEILAETAEALNHEQALLKPQPASHGSAIRVRFGEIPDCRQTIAKLGIEGAMLEGKEILDVIALLETAAEIRSALEFSAETYPRLAARAAQIDDFRPLLRDLSGKVMPDGTLADDASVALKRLRREIERQRLRIQDSLERFLRNHRQEGVLQEEFVTIRNDRFVVPIIAGQQRHVDGVIHASSGTGHTLFLEPIETIELNNDLVRLAEQETAEVLRILLEMTERLRAAADQISIATEAVGQLEFLFAKARFGVKYGGTIPTFCSSDERHILLRDARHPLLEDVLSKSGKSAVPISVELSEENNTLLVSGPNTGGKTVTLKTVGLLTLMAQAGFPVTCAEAVLPLFAEVLADIGDNQSIQESLSTFSAHIMQIREMVEQVSASSLVLLDELGRATDPEEGGALGVAILDDFRRSGAFTLASTHLLALKIYGANTEGVLNASMGFDDETLEPTYQLRIGAPGKSAGLDIASRLGLPASLIERARGNMSSGERDVSLFLNQLHRRLEEVTLLRDDLADREEKLAERERKLSQDWKRRETARLAEIERRGEQAIAQFEEQTRKIIEEIRHESEKRKAASQAQRKASKAAREFRAEFSETVLGRGEQTAATGQVSEGATVRLRGVSQTARVLRFLGENLIEVQAGFMKLQIPLGDVLEVLPSADAGPKLPKNVSLEAGPRWDVTSREINLIGRRAEEARDEVDKFLDSAVLSSVNRLRIVHGHGMGVLRKVIGEVLAESPHVEKFYPAPQSEGGTGATIVELKE